MSTETNDRTEFQIAKDIICPKISEKTQTYIFKTRPDLIQLLKADSIDPVFMCDHDAAVFYEAAIGIPSLLPRISCFSYHNEDHHIENGILSMWRSYCAGEGGICLEFNTKKMSEVTNEILNTYSLSYLFFDQVNYGARNKIVEKRIADSEDVFNMMIQYIEFETGGKKILFDESAILKMLIMACTTKHSDFSDEREVRLICALTEEKDGKRKTPSFVGSKLLLPLADCITGILIGPARDQKALEYAVSSTLKEFGRTDIKVRTSNTPFQA